MVHYLKTEKQYFDAVVSGEKTFEVRINDRHFEVGDEIYLTNLETNQTIGTFEITYLFQNGEYGLKKGYCIFSIRRQP